MFFPPLYSSNLAIDLLKIYLDSHVFFTFLKNHYTSKNLKKHTFYLKQAQTISHPNTLRKV